MRDNRYGHGIHTMATGTFQLSMCAKYEYNVKTVNSVFDNMITEIAFGNNTTDVLNLIGLMIGYDQGYFFRESLQR